MTTTSQNAAILAHLETGAAITPLDAMTRFGCMRLSGRILELRQRGWAIDTEFVRTPTGKRIARYSMAGERERASRAMA